MFKKIKEGYCLEILKLEEKNIIIGCLRNPNSYDEDDDIYYIPSPLLAFIEDYEYIVKYIDQGYHFLCYMENNNYTTKILIDDNYIKSNDIFKVKMPIDLNIAYAEYLNQS